MKRHSLSAQISAGVALAFLACGISNSHAASAPTLQKSRTKILPRNRHFNRSHGTIKVDKLHHAYRLLEHADGDYGGHRLEAMHSIKKAAEVLGGRSPRPRARGRKPVEIGSPGLAKPSIYWKISRWRRAEKSSRTFTAP